MMAFMLGFNVERGLSHELFYLMHTGLVVGRAGIVISILQMKKQTQKGCVLWPRSPW